MYSYVQMVDITVLTWKTKQKYINKNKKQQKWINKTKKNKQKTNKTKKYHTIKTVPKSIQKS